jgi:hypothetical protein
LNKGDEKIGIARLRRNRARRGQFRPRWLPVALLGVTMVVPSLLAGQPAPVKAPPSVDRCLIIVETSKSMQRRADATLNVVRELLMSGLNGQFHEGGTVGIWTYNEELFSGQFPLQVWSPTRTKPVTERAEGFLKGQTYKKRGEFQKVVAALGRVVSDSELLTVVLISSGESGVVGTPYDREINAVFEKWRDRQEKARAPFVTLWRVRKGKAAAYVVNTPPWPIQVPYLPEEKQNEEEVHAVLAQALHGGLTSTVAPLIIKGKKPQPVTPPAPATATAPLVLTSSNALPAVAATNAVAPAKPPEPVVRPAEVAQTGLAPVTPEKPAVAPSTSPAPVPVVAPAPKPETAKAPEPKAADPAPVKIAPAPPPIATTQALVAVKEVATNSTASAPAAVTPPPPSPRPAPAQAATATPGSPPAATKNVWLTAIAVGVGLLAVVLLLLRRRRVAPAGSLITGAIEREKEQ